MESLALIDVSEEDDLLFGIASPSRAGVLASSEASDFEPAGCPQAAVGLASDPGSVAEERATPERTESPKRRKAKTGVNLRKSLAWDSAFFTSEGVLDTEELAIVNSTFRKTQGSRLPGISEEMRRSGESTTSTLDNEILMEGETDLFHDVRASIQMTHGKPNKVPGGPAGSSKPSKATANAPRVAARKAVDRMPQVKLRTPISTSQGIGDKQRSQVTTKVPTAARVTLPGAAEPRPSSKPPRALPRVAMMRSSTNTTITSGISDKRSSTGGVVDRQTVGKSANPSASVRPGVVTKPVSISKSGAITSAATSFHGVLVDTKPDAKTKSATLSSKNRTAQRVPIRSASRSDVSKANPTRLSGNKIPARGHTDRASPTISPSSSIDSMSSVISAASTASTVGKMGHSSESLNVPSSLLSPSLRKSNDCSPTTKGRPPSVTEGQSSGTAAYGDNSKATADASNQGKSFKPSGLRRPRPNRGYFDAEKSIDQNSNAVEQVQPKKIQRSIPATPKSQMKSSIFSEQESKTAAAPHDESSASKSKAEKVVPFIVTQIGVETSNVTDTEVCTHQIGAGVSEPGTEKSIDQNISAHEQLTPLKIQGSLPATAKSQPSSSATTDTESSTLSEQGSISTAAVHEESIASKTMVAAPKVAQMEVEPFKAAEFVACMHHTDRPVVAETEAEKSVDQNVGACVQVQPIEIQLSLPARPNSQLSATQSTITAPSSFSQEESAAPLEDCSALKSKAAKVAPLRAAELDVKPFKMAEQETCTHQTGQVVVADESKENVPALHKNIQANCDASSFDVDLLIQKLSSVSLGETTPGMAS